MTIADIVERHPTVRLAVPGQGAELSEFIRTQMISVDGFSIGFDRGNDFFALLRAYSDQFWAFTFHNDDGSLVGLATLSRHFLDVNGERLPIGYFGDLRLSPAASKRVRVSWRRIYEEVVHHLEDPNAPEHCHALFTAVIDGNIQALNTFRSGLRGVVYHELWPYANLAVFHPLSGLIPGQVAGVRAHPVDLGETRTLILRKPSKSQKLLSRAVQLVKRGNARFSIERPLRIRALTRIEEEQGQSPRARLRAYKNLIQDTFSRSGPDFDFVLLTLRDTKFCRSVARAFPFSYRIGGMLFEVTSAGREPRLRGSDLRFEGAYL